MTTRRASGLIAIVLVMGVAAACSSNTPTSGPTKSSPETSTSTTATPRPTLTGSRLQPPAQDNKYADPGRHAVVFDPCTWISDDDIQRAGFDPRTRKRAHDVVAEYTFLTCHFDSDRVLLSLESGNVSLDEVKKKYAGKTRPSTINGREALITNKSDDTCSVDMQTKVGYFGVTFMPTGRGSEPIQPCDGIVEAATILEPSIGKEN
ncbi:DUF3558 domain-containing protein [Nocardia sp. CA-120079]|uniref:DUF3558 domain-containing protein n=1 Tax=Nocardia sp. CA-120079 TaxID=3239974 RepID=UPI003D97C731